MVTSPALCIKLFDRFPFVYLITLVTSTASCISQVIGSCFSIRLLDRWLVPLCVSDQFGES